MSVPDTNHRNLEESIGADSADTSMGYFPPVGWADVATRRDLDALEKRLDLRLEATEHRILATLRGELVGQTRLMVFCLVAAVFTAVFLAFAAAQLG